jgi:L-fuconolactonase
MNQLLNSIPIIDSHIHLWDIKRLSYSWLDQVNMIKQDFFIEDYQQASKSYMVKKMVFIQGECKTEENLKEIEFVMEQALIDCRIKGIVAYAPLEKGWDVAPILDIFKKNPFIKGVRRMYDDAPEICCTYSFLDGVNLLPEYFLSYDLSIKPSSMQDTIRMISDCPNTQFILDHLGKPDILNSSLLSFKKNMDKLASFSNVVAKISGLITEADTRNWSVRQIEPYVKHVIQCFGFDRLLFGSDWPVLLLAGSYDRWLNALDEILYGNSKENLNKLFYENADRIYKL